MPMIKQVLMSNGVQYSYHTIDRVEFVKFGSTPAWRAYYTSAISPISDVNKLSGNMLTGIPIVASDDPIISYEQACVLSPDCIFFGAEIVSSGDSVTSLIWEKKDRIMKITAARDAELNNGFDTPYGRFSSDATSVLNFVGTAVIAKDMPSTWTTEWTLANNTYVTLTKAKFLEVAGILSMFRTNTYAKGRTLVDTINAATTVEEVKAVTW